MIRFAILEDEKEHSEQAVKYLKQYCEEKKIEYILDVYTGSSEFLDKFRSQYEIILLDIGMSGMNGMEVATELRKRNSTACIIFMTNMPKYAINGYEVDAVGFIVKPIKYSSLSLALNRATSHIERTKEAEIHITTRQGFIAIPASQLLYVESRQHDLIYVTEKTTYRQRGALKDVESHFDGIGFARCNSGYLVNLRNIKAIYENTVFIKEHKLPISRGKKKEFIKAYMEFSRGGVNL